MTHVKNDTSETIKIAIHLTTKTTDRQSIDILEP